MKQLFIFGLLFCTCNFVLNAQNKTIPATKDFGASGFLITSSGLQYKIIKDSVGGIYPEKGGYITFWFDIRSIKDSIFDNQFSDGNPVGIPTPEVVHKPGIEEGLWLLTEGDSAIFVLNADSLYTNTFQRETPSYVPTGSMIYMVVRMSKVYSKHFVDSVMAIQKAEQRAERIAEEEAYQKDSIQIQKYLTDHKLKGEAIEGGVYIVKLKKSSKKLPYIVKGEIVETKYIGKLLIEGVVFDQSTHDYFEFTVGIGEVIKGWDYAFQRLRLGEKALILIPSGSAYGNRGAANVIPPNAPLLFEVDIKKE
ncbi:FKBP-type peptidyl-prolyl cis-trans isomerase [Cytophaga aurantiaca]|uniref:FKBP-type peptidyl-prolyl cis-trans isomerase n=1 Tax=Cytophaga aurantiaca TaxID=29530 RepID=UPI00037BAE3B|nr:FKBP-type peptidyl-prolyl cis-trans isomerase [Cytophaga aurantiaca]